MKKNSILTQILVVMLVSATVMAASNVDRINWSGAWNVVNWGADVNYVEIAEYNQTDRIWGIGPDGKVYRIFDDLDDLVMTPSSGSYVLLTRDAANDTPFWAVRTSGSGTAVLDRWRSNYGVDTPLAVNDYVAITYNRNTANILYGARVDGGIDRFGWDSTNGWHKSLMTGTEGKYYTKLVSSGNYVLAAKSVGGFDRISYTGGVIAVDAGATYKVLSMAYSITNANRCYISVQNVDGTCSIRKYNDGTHNYTDVVLGSSKRYVSLVSDSATANRFYGAVVGGGVDVIEYFTTTLSWMPSEINSGEYRKLIASPLGTTFYGLKGTYIPSQCGDAGTDYLQVDLNKDCQVDMKDFAQFAADWMECTDPEDDTCSGWYWQ